jgi:hypothetical protein
LRAPRSPADLFEQLAGSDAETLGDLQDRRDLRSRFPFSIRLISPAWTPLRSATSAWVSLRF